MSAYMSEYDAELAHDAMVEAAYDRLRHGSPYDRGSADAYYGRRFRPHYFTGDSYTSPEVTDLNEIELAAYTAGYEECPCGTKDWG